MPAGANTVTRRWHAIVISRDFGGLDSGQFRYVGEWHGENSAVLEFETTIGDVQVNGVDMIWWNAAGQITKFKVMLRPIKALQTVVPLMAQALQGGAPG